MVGVEVTFVKGEKIVSWEKVWKSIPMFMMMRWKVFDKESVAGLLFFSCDYSGRDSEAKIVPDKAN